MELPKHVEPAHKDILYLSGVSVSFDGFKALNSLSLYVKEGELRAIIGPNGAGKTTMMDVITGKVKPDTGDVMFKSDIDLTRYDEAAIANMGIGRKFQKPSVIESLTVYENLELAHAGQRSVWSTLSNSNRGKLKDAIMFQVGEIGLASQVHDSAGALSHGQKQWLEIGMLLMQKPELLLIDEPAAGMTDHETEKTAELLTRISGERSVVVIEHDMDFIGSLNAPVTVLHEGSVLAEGTLEAVQSNEQVIDVYLGR